MPTLSRYNSHDSVTLIEISKISPETADAYEEIAEKIEIEASGMIAKIGGEPFLGLLYV